MQLHFQRFGDGFPLLILHGLFGSLDNWQSIARSFGESFQVFTIDLRNHGRSPHHEDFNYAVMAQDLREFMAAHSLARAHLLGHSLGGKVAMHFALANPEWVEKLVVLDMAPKAYPPLHENIFQAMRGLNLALFNQRSEIENELAPSITDQPTRQFLLKNIRRDEAGGFQWKINLPVLYKNYPALNESLAGAIPFPRPTLFIRGESSDYLQPGDEILIQELFPLAEIKTVPKAGHWIHADAPEALKKLALDFLKK